MIAQWPKTSPGINKRSVRQSRVMSSISVAVVVSHNVSISVSVFATYLVSVLIDGFSRSKNLMMIVFRSQCGRRVGLQGVPQQLGERSPTCNQLQEWTARVGWGVALLQTAGGECTRSNHLASLLKAFLAGPHTPTAANTGEAHYFPLYGTRAQQPATSAAGGGGKAAGAAATTAPADAAHDAGATASPGSASL